MIASFAVSSANTANALVSFKKASAGNDTIRYIPVHHPDIKIGLALSGGGTRGVAHITLLEELEKLGIPVHYISGTSIGALVGGFYCSGYSPREIKDLFYQYDWRKLYLDKADRQNVIVPQKENMGNYLIRLGFSKDGPYIPTSLSYGQNILTFLSLKTAASSFNYNHDYKSLPVGLNIISTDLLTGNKIVFYSGNLGKNMLASMAFPLLFAPVEFDTLMLMDGGISTNIPVNEVRKIGANFVIANDVTAGLRSRKYLKLPWQIADQVTTIMMQDNLHKNQIAADFLLSPSLKKFSSTDISNFNKFWLEEKKEITRNRKNLIDQISSNFNFQFSIDSLDVSEIIFDFYAGDNLIHKSYQNTDSLIVLNACYYKWQQKYMFDDISIHYHPKSQKLFLKLSYWSDSVKITSPDSLFRVDIGKMVSKKPYLKYINLNDLKLYWRKYFNRKGYFACKVETDNLHHGIVVHPGKIDEIHVIGNSSTKDYIIVREVSEKLAVKATLDDFNSSIKNIYGTNLFHLVELFPYQNDDKNVLEITVKEKASFSARLGLRYTIDRLVESKISFSEENLLGRKYNFITDFIFGNYRKSGTITLKSDKIYKSNFSAFSTIKFEEMIFPVYMHNRKIDKFTRKIRNIDIGLGKSVERLGFVSISLVFDQMEGPANLSLLSSNKYQSWGLRLVSIVDNRDKDPFPTSGEYIKWGWESYNQVLPSQLNSTKAWIEGNKYLKISKYSTINFFSNNGIAENTLPFVKWFSPGEYIRKTGWHNFEYWGKMFLISGAELRAKIFPHFWGEKYFSLKYDYGSIWRSSEEQFNWRDMESGLSLGFMLATIVGPVEIKYEMAEKRKPLWWFNMGFYF